MPFSKKSGGVKLVRQRGLTSHAADGAEHHLGETGKSMDTPDLIGRAVGRHSTIQRGS